MGKRRDSTTESRNDVAKGHCQVGDWCGPKWMISESIRNRRTIVGEVSYKGHRYPAEIIAHCVWLYHLVPAELPRGRGAHGGPRRDRLLRDDSRPNVEAQYQHREVALTAMRRERPNRSPQLVDQIAQPPPRHPLLVTSLGDEPPHRHIHWESATFR